MKKRTNLLTNTDSALSSQLIAQAHERYGIAPNSLTLHQDRGVPMTAHCYLDLLGSHQHHHSGLAGFTPYQVFSGQYLEIAQVRQA